MIWDDAFAGIETDEGQGCDSYMLDTAIPRTKMCALTCKQ